MPSSSKGQQIPGADYEQDDEDEEEEGQDPNLVSVVLGPKGRGKIFYEWHQSHPNDHVAHVVEGWVVEVALTPGVREALGSGILKQSSRRPTPLPPSVAEIIDQRNLVAPAPQQPGAQPGVTVAQDAPAATTPPSGKTAASK